MISEAQKRASAKWAKNNMAMFSCKMTKDKANAFKNACEKLGLVPNQVFNRAADEVINEAEEDQNLS